MPFPREYRGKIQHIPMEQPMNEIPRIVEEAQKNIVAKMATMILSIPRLETDAITVFPGRGENVRLEYAVKVWQYSQFPGELRFFLVAGTEWKTEAKTPQPTLELLQGNPYNLRKMAGVYIQYHAHCTPDQTGWVLEKVRACGIKSLSLIAPPYHLPRAYLTLLKELYKQSICIPIIPLPVPTSPDTIVPEDGVDAWTLFDGEAERILKYQEKGDVATLPELKEYLCWLWKQPLLQN